jgi:hypothetical protein
MRSRMIDFHVVIANPKNLKQTMIIEFPNSECSLVAHSARVKELRCVGPLLTTDLGAISIT